MDYIKKLMGAVAGIFCTLIGAWACATCFNPDFKWYYSLIKPIVVPNGGFFTLAAAVVYALHIAVIARLVIGKHFYPSMLILGAIELFSVLFMYAFFTLSNAYLAEVFIIITFVISFIQQTRFFIKELRIALYYLPIFIFNCYCLILVTSIALAN